MLPFEKLAQIRQRFECVQSELADPKNVEHIARLSREFSKLQPLVDSIVEFEALNEEIEATEEIRGDPEIRELAEEELTRLRSDRDAIEDRLLYELLSDDPDDEKSVVLEIRAGTGGEEAALFCGDLYRMYERLAERMGWKFEPLDISDSTLGGFKEITATIKGEKVFAKLKHESGVHRVQRVPATESSGRIHTSAATVAILPEAREVDIEISPADVRIDTMRASGAGGQHVNTTDSAVRITHIPTGISVMSSEKSQHRNRAQAMTVLRSRLYSIEAKKAFSKRAADRKMQVGSGDRSERIRTYNFPQGRLTDHRINLTLYKLEHIMQGDLGEVIDALMANERAERLAQLST